MIGFKKKNCFFLFLCIFAFYLFTSLQVLALVIPEKPSGYVNDYAKLLSPGVKSEIEKTLLTFEKETSNQVVVVTFESLEGESLEDFSIRLVSKWKIGTKKHDNGVVLLIFKKEHEVRIEVGYGLEGVFPDAICDQIIRHEIVPAFKNGDFNMGILNAINAITRATKGEYTSSSEENFTLGKQHLFFVIMLLYLVFPILAFLLIIFLSTQFLGFPLGLIVGIGIVIILMLIRIIFFSSMFGQTLYGSNRGAFMNNNFLGGGFGGGGFSGGGGGSFGGGGASGQW